MVDYYSGDADYTLTVTITYGGGGSGSWGTGGKYAIIVGISDYASISDLSYCDEDATDWYNFLVGPVMNATYTVTVTLVTSPVTMVQPMNQLFVQQFKN
jgi:hypothetical protein